MTTVTLHAAKTQLSKLIERAEASSARAFLRWLAGDTSLSDAARDLITDEASMIFVSAASAWEIATKHRLGKLAGAAAIAPDIEGAVRRQGFEPHAVVFDRYEVVRLW